MEKCYFNVRRNRCLWRVASEAPRRRIHLVCVKPLREIGDGSGLGRRREGGRNATFGECTLLQLWGIFGPRERCSAVAHSAPNLRYTSPTAAVMARRRQRTRHLKHRFLTSTKAPGGSVPFPVILLALQNSRDVWPHRENGG